MQSWRLAWLRFSRRTSGLGGAIALIAAVQGVLVLVLCAQPSVEAEAVRERISGLPAPQQWITVSTTDAATSPAVAGPAARSALAALTDAPGATALVFRPLSDLRSGRYQLLAATPIGRDFRLLSGRMPAVCNAHMCEVLAVGDVAAVPVGLQIVGRARLRAGSVLEQSIETGCTLLVSADPQALAARAASASTPRTLMWSARLDAGSIARNGLQSYLKRVTVAVDALALRSSDMTLELPTTQLEAVRLQVQSLERRMLGLTLCLILALLFSVHGIAVASRASHAKLMRLTRELAWPRRRRVLTAVASAVIVTAVGMVLGTVLSVLAALAAFGSAPPGSVVSMWSMGFGASCAMLIAAGLHADARVRWACVLAILLMWSAAADAAGLDLGVLALAAAAALATALLPRGLRAIRLPVFARNLVRAQGQRLIALSVVLGFLVGFIASSVATLATLQQGVVDHAVFQSPLATRITWGDRLPLQDRSLADYRALAGGARVFPVRTVTATVHRSIVDVMPVQMIAVAPRAWTLMSEMRRQTGLSNSTMASTASSDVPAPGMAALGGQPLRARVSGLARTVALGVWVLSDDGEAEQLSWTIDAAGTAHVTLPSRTARVLGFSLTELPDAAVHRAHAVGEGTSTLAAPSGELVIAGLTLGARPFGLAIPKGSPLRTAGATLLWRYVLVGGEGWAPVGATPPALHGVVDAETAASARDGVVAMRLTDELVVPVRVDAVADRMPTLPQHFAVVAPSALDAWLAFGAPKQMRVSELWTNGRLRSESDLIGLTVTTQAGVRARTSGSSLSDWNVRTLGLLLLVVLLVIVLMLRAFVRDLLRSGDLRGWWAQGLAPASMSRSIRRLLAALGCAAAAVAIPVVRVLFPAVIASTSADISGSPAVPPLAAVFDWPAQFAALAVMCLFVVVTTAVSARPARVQAAAEGASP